MLAAGNRIYIFLSISSLPSNSRVSSVASSTVPVPLVASSLPSGPSFDDPFNFFTSLFKRDVLSVGSEVLLDEDISYKRRDRSPRNESLGLALTIRQMLDKERKVNIEAQKGRLKIRSISV